MLYAPSAVTGLAVYRSAYQIWLLFVRMVADSENEVAEA